ncbi:Protein jagged-2, partial [Armadillidium nasatum]
CRPGWEGEFCDECKSHPGCKHGFCNGVPFTCECELNWGGILCDQDLNYCGRYPCQNGGTCENTAPDQYNCTCAEGFSGENCEIVEDPCAPGPCNNGGTCMEVDGGFQCTCAPGWEGNTCKTNTNECESSPCQNGGTCQDFVNGFNCNCTEGWSGSTCQEGIISDWFSFHSHEGRNCEENINDCESNPCRNDGECVDLIDGFRCICAVGYSGVQCETDIDLCNPNPCFNGAVCINTQSDYFCHCSDRWSGKNCSDSRPKCVNPPCQGEVKYEPSNICGKNGRCVSYFDGAFSCVCDPGYTGQFCHININECESNPCQNGGTCVDQIDGFLCVCDLGWEGQLCNIEINECFSSPCKNNGTCKDGLLDFKCECLLDWKGRTCSSKTSHCEKNTCLNGGTCYDLANSFVCHCTNEWRGSVCHIPIHRPCDSSPCLNGGTCVNSDDGATCICRDGFEGSKCETNIDDCEKKPCYNDGRCIDGINWRMCECQPGFKGPDCRVLASFQCSSSPCSYGAKCIDEIGGYRCVCPKGRFGKNCEKMDNIPPLPLNGATPDWCQWAGELKPHGSVWRHQCNSCHCSHGSVTCSTVWCGPENCLDSNDNSYPCDPRQVCIADPPELCISPPCQGYGECRGLEGGQLLSKDHPGSPDCEPNNSQLSNTCALLTLILDLETAPAGTHVHTVCAGLRAAWADRHAHAPSTPPVILFDSTSGALAAVTVALVILIIVAVLGLGYWHFKRRHLNQSPLEYPHNPSHLKYPDDPHVEKTNNENEEKLRRYHNPLRGPSLFWW